MAWVEAVYHGDHGLSRAAGGGPALSRAARRAGELSHRSCLHGVTAGTEDRAPQSAAAPAAPVGLPLGRVSAGSLLKAFRAVCYSAARRAASSEGRASP